MRGPLRRLLLVCAVALACAAGRTAQAAAPPAAAGWTEHPEWGACFAAESLAGTIAVYDERTGLRGAYDLARASRRYVPASTFKIPHALFALDAGLVKDEFTVFPWDSIPGEFDGWDADQTLRTSMSRSVLWVYQRFARALGANRERAYLVRAGYGNADPGGAIDRFWIDGDLRISAVEQVEFLRRLRHNALPFSPEHQRLVKDAMIVDATREWVLRGKTGWSGSRNGNLGWFVGWLERAEGTVYFAVNVDLARGAEDLPKRERIARAALRVLDALPEDR
ncbi:MAG: class D beta-lactamase [Candidatus Eisenbacteria bacterium]